MTRKRSARAAPDAPAPDVPDAAPAPAPDAARYRVLAAISTPAGASFAPGDVAEAGALPHLDAHLAFGEVEIVEEAAGGEDAA